MRYAKVKNDKVVHTIQGQAPSGYVKVIKNWSKPEEYPTEFYFKSSSEPIVTVEDGEVQENWTFTLLSVERIKNVIYSIQEKIRWKMQLGSFEFDGSTIILEDRNDIENIKSLSGNSRGYKYGLNKWKRGQGKITQLKTAANAHQDAAFDWEMDENDAVTLLTTEDELKSYYELTIKPLLLTYSISM